MAHDQRAGIAVSDEFVIRAAADLHLIFIEPMRKIPGRHDERRVEAVGIVDGEGRVGQMSSLVLRDGRLDAARGEAAPDRRQFGQNRAVAVELARLIGRETGKAIGAGKAAVKIVEAAVFRVEHDDRVDFFEALGDA